MRQCIYSQLLHRIQSRLFNEHIDLALEALTRPAKQHLDFAVALGMLKSFNRSQSLCAYAPRWGRNCQVIDCQVGLWGLWLAESARLSAFDENPFHINCLAWSQKQTQLNEHLENTPGKK